MGWQTVVMDSLGFGKVLLVEDDEKLAGLIAYFLSQHGFEVRQVHRGDLALAAFLEFKPKMVVHRPDAAGPERPAGMP